MKSSRLFRILAVVILAGIVLYFGIQVSRYVEDPLSTTRVYEAKTEDSIHTEGWMVREEEPFHISGGILSHPVQEGEHVGAGQTIAVAYHNAGALDTVKAVEEKTLQLQQLEFALETYLDPDAALKLDGSISDGLLTLRGNVSDGDYTAASEQLSTLKADILKRSHSYSSGPEIQAEIEAVSGELAGLKAALSDAETVRSSRPGTYSTAADGYESVLTPEFIEDVTPTALEEIQKQEEPADAGKLIYGDTWYYTAVMDETDADRIAESGTVRLRFAKGLDRDVKVSVHSVSEPEDGRCAVVLECRKFMAEITQLRRVQAEVILESYSGLRVPANALRLDEAGRGGVYCLVGYASQFKPVEVVWQGEGYSLLRPAEDATDNRLLRAGDEVIITADELHDGKIIYGK